MFEIKDQDLGKLKIYNVTEARANFAEVLKDRSNTVVTRHGKPMKAIIDYSEWSELRKAITKLVGSEI